jgi:RNA polymerase sigma factor (sigma-70 family)
MTLSNLEQLAQDAKGGDREALETLICKIQTPIFRMAFRMLGYPEDAEDAAQEILIKVITHLGDFRGESSFKSWLYRVACNHLLNTRKRRAERMNIDFDLWEELIHVDSPTSGSDALPDAEKALLVEEVRIGCTQGMLQCLDRDHRMAVILGEIFEVTSQEGAFILDITPETFRKRLSRGRQRIHAFMRKNCTLINQSAPCRCRDQVDRDLTTGWIDRKDLHFAKYFSSPEEQARVLQGLAEMEEMARMTHIFRQYPAYQSPESFPNLVKDLIDAGKFPTLTD